MYVCVLTMNGEPSRHTTTDGRRRCAVDAVDAQREWFSGVVGVGGVVAVVGGGVAEMGKRKRAPPRRWGAKVHTQGTAREAPGSATGGGDGGAVTGVTAAGRGAEERAGRWREVVCDALAEATASTTEADADATMVAARVRAHAVTWDANTRVMLLGGDGCASRVDVDGAVLDTLEDLERRGVCARTSAASTLKFKRRYALAKGVAEAMRAMAQSAHETSSSSSSGRGSDDEDDGGNTSALGRRSKTPEPESDDDHFDDSFDEITDDEGDGANGKHNFSFNLETDTEDDGDEDDDSLHGQMVEFAKRCEPTEHERERRDKVFAQIEASISRAYGGKSSSCSLHLFGSGATGLALAGADIDLVLLGVGPQSRKGGGGGFTRSEREDIVHHLRKIARVLRKDNAVSRAEIIATAKVPIVKMKSAQPPYIAVDLSLGTSNGLDAVDWIREQTRKYAALKPLVFFIKRLLATHHLNDAATGGCGGYLLVSLVVSHLKQTGTPEAVNKPGVLGDLLVGFLRRFGTAFDYKHNAVAAGRETGVMSAAALPGPPFGVRPYIMAEDPQEPLRCFTAAAHRFREVQNLFRLTAEHIMVSGELSLLHEVAAPAPRAGSMFTPRGGQLVKVRKNTIVRRDAPQATTSRGGHAQFIRKKNAANSFSPNKPDWTDKVGGSGGSPKNKKNANNAATNNNGKRPRASTAWLAGGHKGFGGDVRSGSPAKRVAKSATFNQASNARNGVANGNGKANANANARKKKNNAKRAKRK